ncbi:unnamed protein product [Absidia cylindrospora]
MPQLSDGSIHSALESYNPSSSLLTTALPLLPFQNQVGGHCSFFRFSKRAICKPMSQKEQEFYEYLERHHAPLLPFTSQYLGVVNVTYRSSKAQPMLPEVILEENQHLLASWKNYCSTNNPGQQQQQYPPRTQLRRHSSSFTLKTRSDTFDLKRGNLTHDLETKPQASSWSPLKFKEQVLREVFSPGALQERLQQVQHWQHGMKQRQLDDRMHADRNSNNSNNTNTSSNMRSGDKERGDSHCESYKTPRLQTSCSVSDFHDQRMEKQFTSFENSNNNNISGDKDQYDDDSTSNYNSELKVTVHPRKPSLIDSTTSAPQTPHMREAKLHDSFIRPPPSATSSTSTQTDIPNNAPTSSIAQQHDDFSNPTPGSTNWRPRQEPTNPWSVQMYQRDLEKVNVDDIQQFILIEDLTDDIKYPCVLDLKMGVRQHSVYSSTKKMISQTKKCEQSTSLQLGVRISGMQIYNVKEGQFLFEDKYMGRALTPQTFRDSLVRYFDNGEGCHIMHLPTLIRKLTLIHRIIKTMDAFRFYASSLLIIYDAADTNGTNTLPKRRIDVRLIDFAKSITKEEWISQQHRFTYPPTKDEGNGGNINDSTITTTDTAGPDQGYLLGVQTLIACFSWIYVNHGGNKNDLMDLDDMLLSMDRLSWLDDDSGTPKR